MRRRRRLSENFQKSPRYAYLSENFRAHFVFLAQQRLTDDDASSSSSQTTPQTSRCSAVSRPISSSIRHAEIKDCINTKFQLIHLCPNILICFRQTQSYSTQIIKMKKPGSTISTSSKIRFEEPESSSSEDEEEIEQELADVTFGELQKARSNGSHLVHPKPKEEKKGGRANKNRPMEVSCKKPVTRFREIIQGSKKVVRDPRFESLCGTLDVDGFRKRYDFLFANELPAEREELQKQVKKSKDPEVIEELKKRISWIDKQLKSESAKRTEAAILAEHKQKEREAAKQGKQPFFSKKSEIRKKRLMEKYKQLKGSGKLEAFIEKRRRKNAAKDHRYMPYRRPDNTEQQI
ncbi:ribosomal RNA processing protein 36 homolog [Prunus yedoensis var. nudiflora]|uniref:rRNA biogenesis protein RRP36 n=1 Tax=Prunus yedoensis var. nudiflora TaxID=2094558 RepID=A0A315ALH9_PRUYE|nr:ribosomal RNA processing protein 36 homolog [Prunus yedoensis var. nudiflora]